MTVATTSNRKTYSGNGATTAFPTTFEFGSEEDLVVIIQNVSTGVETTKALTTDFTVTGGDGDTGTVTMLVPPATGETITIYNDPAITQLLDLVEGDVSPAEAKERAYDRLTFISQRLKDRVDRALRLPESEDSSVVLPSSVERASKYMAFDASGGIIAADAPEGGNVVSAFMATVLDDVDAAAARATLGADGPADSNSLTNKTISASLNTLTGFDFSGYLANLALAVSVATNALTIEVKGKSGSDPSASNKVFVGFRSATATSGSYVQRAIAAALSLVIPSGTSIGTVSGVTSCLFVYLIDNAGVPELAISCSGHFGEGTLQTTVAISGGTDATKLYATNVRTNVAVRLIGRITVAEATAGTWATAPTEVSLTPFRSSKQVVVGTAQTADGTVSSVTFAALNNTISVSFIAAKTGLYKVYSTSFVASQNNNLTTMYFKIAATAGSPTTLADGQSEIDVPTANIPSPHSVIGIYGCVAGTTYTFQLQAKAPGGGQITCHFSGRIAANLIAEEM